MKNIYFTIVFSILLFIIEGHFGMATEENEKQNKIRTSCEPAALSQPGGQGEIPTNPIHSRSNSKEEKLPNNKIIKLEEDTFEDSASIIFSFKEEIKNSRRILSLDGGGLRGLFSIMELCVLEEIMNDPINITIRKKILGNDNNIYIRDVFDVAAGTSTGAIIAAGLFLCNDQKKYSAIDIAKLYVRCGHRIFDKRKLGAGFNKATFSNKGIKELLDHFFGNNPLSDIKKNIYIVALNETKQEPTVYSNVQFILDDKTSNIPIKDAVLYSSLAPIYFPAEEIRINDKPALMSDGGTVANNPAHLSFMKEKRFSLDPFEVYSFGTGIAPPAEARFFDSGVLAVRKIFMNSFIASQNLAYMNCVDEICAMSSQLQYFARINPKIEEGKDRIDDVRDSYTAYAIKKAFSLTQGDVFTSMVKHLGFSIPNLEKLGEFYEGVRNKLYTIKSKVYNDLDKYEKDFIVKKVINLDLDFICYGDFLYQENDSVKPSKMNKKEYKKFLQDLQFDIIKKHKKHTSYASKFWKFIQTKESDKIEELLPRCREFHQLLNSKMVLTDKNIHMLIKNKPQLTQEQISSLNENSSHGFKHMSESMTNLSEANILAFRLFNTFLECCTSKEANYKYNKHNDNFMKLITLIFWKNSLKNIEGQISKHQIMELKENLQSIVTHQILRDRASYQTIADNFLQSRYWELTMGLDKYEEKYCD